MEHQGMVARRHGRVSLAEKFNDDSMSVRELQNQTGKKRRYDLLAVAGIQLLHLPVVKGYCSYSLPLHNSRSTQNRHRQDKGISDSDRERIERKTELILV